jgi:hypothetical protein
VYVGFNRKLLISSGAIVYEGFLDDIYNREFSELKDLVEKLIVRKQGGELISFLHCKFEVPKSVITCNVLKTLTYKCMKFGILVTEKIHVAIFRDMTLNILIGVTGIPEEHTASIFRGLQIIGNHMPGYTVSTLT